MKHFILVVLTLASACCSTSLWGQADLQNISLSTREDTVNLTAENDRVLFNLPIFVQNNSTVSATGPLTLKVWTSIDNQFTPEDLPRLVQIDSIRACAVGETFCPQATDRSYEIFFPFSGTTILPGEQLAGNTRTAMEWFGDSFFVKICIVDSNDQSIELKCNDGLRSRVEPPTGGAVGLPDGDSDIPANTFLFPVIENNNRELLVTHIQYRVRNLLENADAFSGLADLTTLPRVLYNGTEMFQLQFASPLPEGVQLRMNVSTCFDRISELFCSLATSTQSGSFNVAKEFNALPDENSESITVSWKPYNLSTSIYYRLIRCFEDFGNIEICETIDLIDQGTDVSYVDTGLLIGRAYDYDIEVCTQRNSFTQNCSFNRFERTGFVNSAMIGSIPLDEYEIDSTPEQAKLVRRNMDSSRAQARTIN